MSKDEIWQQLAKIANHYNATGTRHAEITLPNGTFFWAKEIKQSPTEELMKRALTDLNRDIVRLWGVKQPIIPCLRVETAPISKVPIKNDKSPILEPTAPQKPLFDFQVLSKKYGRKKIEFLAKKCNIDL